MPLLKHCFFINFQRTFHTLTKEIAHLIQPKNTMSAFSKDSSKKKTQVQSRVDTHLKPEEYVNYNVKNKSLGENGAYQLAQRMKNDTLKYGTLKKLDVSENRLHDEGIIYISISIKSLGYLETLNASNNEITEYGLRMLLETLKYTSLKQLDISSNPLGVKGAEYLAKSLSTGQITLTYLSAHACNFGVDGGKILGVAISSNTSIKILDLSRNNIKGSGAILVTRGITTNNTLETVNLSHNNFGMLGSHALSDLIKLNTAIKTLNLNSCNLIFETDSKFPEALSVNSSLKNLYMDDNSILPNVIFDILDNLNGKKSRLELLNIKSVQVPKCTSMMIELVQQKRTFTCIHGPTIKSASLEDSIYDLNPMVKLANILASKNNMNLIDLLRIINPTDDSKLMAIDKEEFSRRLRMFDQRLSQKDINIIIEKLLTTGDKITYGSLVKQQKSEKVLSEEALQTKKKQLDKRDAKNLPDDMYTDPSRRNSFLTNSKDSQKRYNSKNAKNKVNLVDMMNTNNRHIGCLNTNINYFDTSYLESNKLSRLNYVDKWLENDTLKQDEKPRPLENEEPRAKTTKFVKLPPTPSSKPSSPRKSINSSSGYGASPAQSSASSLQTNKTLPKRPSILKSLKFPSSPNGKTSLPSFKTESESSALHAKEVRCVSIRITDQTDIFGNQIQSAGSKKETRESTNGISPPPNMREYKPIKSS